MKATIIGLQYGDEGKGRVVGYFSKDYDWSIRFNGSANAGHTVYNDSGKKFKLHQIPSGAVFGKKVALDAGMALDLEKIETELNDLEMCFDDLYVSENVHLINQSHRNNDSDGSGIGSTKSGIAYVYSDRALRKGKRVGNMFKNSYRGLPPVQSGESALFEGAQGIMLDVDYGDYPYVTSSSIMPSSAYRIDRFIGVMKAYTSRVGDGPPYAPDIEELRVLGDEYGTTTGRPRKCTWNSLEQIKYAISIVNPDEIVVTKLDILKDVEKICVYDENGRLKTIGGLDNYKSYLTEKIPQIKWFSESPMGEMIKIK